MKHSTGAIPSTKDKRDYLYDDLGMSSTPFDWVEGYDVEEKVGHKLKAKDQNGSYSCGGQAFAYYAEILDVVHDKKRTKSLLDIYMLLLPILLAVLLLVTYQID